MPLAAPVTATRRPACAGLAEIVLIGWALWPSRLPRSLVVIARGCERRPSSTQRCIRLRLRARKGRTRREPRRGLLRAYARRAPEPFGQRARAARDTS